MKIHSLLAGVANVHLIGTNGGVVLVDAGWPRFGPYILAHLARLGYQPRDVRAIILTHVHVDHAGGAAALRRITGAPIAVHRGDAVLANAGSHRIPPGRGWAGASTRWLFERLAWELTFEKFAPDIWLDDGQKLNDLGLEGTVVHTPGHTRGSITLALEGGNTVVGDALINLFRVGLPMYWEDAQAGQESAWRIQSLSPRVLYTGHGRAFGRDQLDRYLAQRTRAEQAKIA